MKLKYYILIHRRWIRIPEWLFYKDTKHFKMMKGEDR